MVALAVLVFVVVLIVGVLGEERMVGCVLLHVGDKVPEGRRLVHVDDSGRHVNECDGRIVSKAMVSGNGSLRPTVSGNLYTLKTPGNKNTCKASYVLPSRHAACMRHHGCRTNCNASLEILRSQRKHLEESLEIGLSAAYHRAHLGRGEGRHRGDCASGVV